MSGSAVPAGNWPMATRAPGKCILFGEHAVVHGRPELLLAIDLYLQVIVREGSALRLNGDTTAPQSNPYLGAGLERFHRGAAPLELTVTSRIPRAAGLGSSAAFCAALAANLGSAAGGLDRATLAQESFVIEREAQGVGSPGDTSASVAGGYLTLNGGNGDVLWEVSDGVRRWTARRVEDPGWIWVVAYSGIPRSTGEAVRKVGARLAEPDGEDLLKEFERVALDGIRSLAKEDRAEVANLLDSNQELLRQVGVSHPRLEALLSAVRPAAEGAKLTGAGAGGSVVVLPRPGRELEAARLISRAGGVSYVVRPAKEGAQVLLRPG
jgi:mevalonate kinase